MPTKHSRTESFSETENPRKRHTFRTSESRLVPNAIGDNTTKLERFNRKFLESLQRECTKALERDVDGDLEPLLEKYRSRYARFREARTTIESDPPAYPSNCQLGRSTHGTSMVITHSLDPKVRAIIENVSRGEFQMAGPSNEETMMSRIKAAIERGKKLYTSGGRTVTQIHPNVVVKTGRELDLNEVTIMEHIHQASKGFALPQPLGSVTCNGTTFIFMTFIEGSSLQELWPSLSVELKMSVCDQLNAILLNLRSLPLPSPQLGGGTPPRCKDVRRSVRTSTSPINNESEFNDFLLSTIKPRIAQSFREFIRTICLHSHHRIVMTHGDLHPRNILAELHDGHVTIKGIVDWEAGGSYPEYWEYVKSLNTMSSVEEDDWWQYLPVLGMGQYYNEWAADMLLETLIET